MRQLRFGSEVFFAVNDTLIRRLDVNCRFGLEPLTSITTTNTVGGSYTLFSLTGNSVQLVDKGSESAHWISTMQDAVVTAKLPSKIAAGALKHAITTTLRLSASVTMAVDNVVIGKPSPVTQSTLEEKIRFSLVVHDKLDPSEPLIRGNYSERSTDVLAKNARGGYSWVWRPQQIEEDNGFWLMWMPLPKGLGFLKGAARGAEVVEEGVYEIVVSGSEYVGQSQDVISRVLSHVAKGGKFYKKQLEREIYHAMPGSMKLDREVYEQYRILKYGIKNLRNIRNPMGGRMALYKKMIDKVMKKYNLPK